MVPSLEVDRSAQGFVELWVYAVHPTQPHSNPGYNTRKPGIIIYILYCMADNFDGAGWLYLVCPGPDDVANISDEKQPSSLGEGTSPN